MAMVMMLVAALAAQEPSAPHVRASDPRVLALFRAGLSRSPTFRQLVDTLDHSDVIVYVEPKLTREALGGFLSHTVVTGGAYRYLHIAINTRGAEERLVALFAHELQHAVEVAQHDDVRDERRIRQLFDSLAIKFGCGGTSCSETQAAKDVEATVATEWKR
jgi:hypothetical protein